MASKPLWLKASICQQINVNRWPNDKQATNKTNHDFLLLVGDPKQAIYGFRGGDAANYNYMKAQFEKAAYWTLDVNRRFKRQCD